MAKSRHSIGNAANLSNTGSPPFAANRFLHLVIVVYATVWIGVAVTPRDWPTWALENLLVVAFAGLLASSYRRFAFSNLSYLLIAIFLGLHAIGAQSGYAHSPTGNWLKTVLGLSRNPYDRIVHVAFGLLLAYPVYELLIRTGGTRGVAAKALTVSIVMAVSVIFEVIESIVSEIVSPGTGPAWLGAQGDEWDSQLDMAAALVGAFVAMLITYCHEFASRSRAGSQ